MKGNSHKMFDVDEPIMTKNNASSQPCGVFLPPKVMKRILLI